jgi:hypothetical protein
MPKTGKRVSKKEEIAPASKEVSSFDRAPRQKPSDRNAVKSAEETRDVPNKHGAIK